eukprot:scaffold4400_cov91-Cylindrotheca_fusiformis.AAC.1
MKALLICVGSRGDAEPFVALADRLLEGGHSVDFFVQPELKDLSPPAATGASSAPNSSTFTIHELPFTQFDFYKYAANPTKGKDLDGRMRFVAIVADVIGELVLPHWEAVYNVAKDSQVLVTTALARPLCFALSSKLDIPTVLIHLQPLVPTKLFPHYSNTDDFVKTLLALEKDFDANAGSDGNLESYWKLEKAQHEFLEERLDNMYDALELTPKMDFEKLQTVLSGNDPCIFLGNAFFDALIPKILDAGTNVRHLGPLADHYIPNDFEPPSDVVSFLSDNNPKPICVGFGSMPYNQVAVVLEALRELDRKAILVGKALELPVEQGEWNKENVVQTPNLPYAWLLPRCEMMLCHGGAGVVHATLRAGIPIVISPMMGDQFCFAELVQAKGLGARAGVMLPQATKEDFVAAIEKATNCIGTAQAFGEEARSQPLGVDKLKDLLESIVAT